MAEPDPQRTLAEAAAAEPGVSTPLDRIPSDAATVGSEIAPVAALQSMEPGRMAASEGLPQGFGAVGEPVSATPEPTVGRTAALASLQSSDQAS